jgi:hypothetical protein
MMRTMMQRCAVLEQQQQEAARQAEQNRLAAEKAQRESDEKITAQLRREEELLKAQEEEKRIRMERAAEHERELKEIEEVPLKTEKSSPFAYLTGPSKPRQTATQPVKKDCVVM